MIAGAVRVWGLFPDSNQVAITVQLTGPSVGATSELMNSESMNIYWNSYSPIV